MSAPSSLSFVVSPLTSHVPLAAHADTEAFELDPFRRVPRAQTARFFARARTFMDAFPWDVLPATIPIGIDLPHFGVFGACVFLWGAPETHHGLMYFPTYDAYATFCARSAARLRTGQPHSDDLGAPFACIDFFAEDELHPALMARLRERGFPLGRQADDVTIPSIVELGGVRRELHAEDLAVFSSVLVALTDLAIGHADALLQCDSVQAFVEIDGVPPAIVECPHPEWAPAFDDDDDELSAYAEVRE